MPQATYSDIMSIITRKNRLFIPDVIEDAILNCITEDISTVKQAGDDIIKAFNVYNKAATIDYDRPEVVDAYSLYYLRRNSLIPRISFRDIVLNHKLQTLPANMKILDLGSGTGAVTIGLLEMFLHPPLDSIEVQVHALDASASCLERLSEHVEACDLSKFIVKTENCNLYDIKSLDKFLRNNGPYNIIFAANVFNELEPDQSCAIIRCLSQHLSEKSFIVIVNAQRDFIKRLQPLLVTEAVNNGLTVYYPCPSYNHASHNCWFWREHDYFHRRIRKKGQNTILSSHREQLVATWLILCNLQCTIYDDFGNQYPNLKWGVFNIMGKDSRYSDCQICTGLQRIQLGHQDKIIKRGAIVGFSENPLEISQYFEI